MADLVRLKNRVKLDDAKVDPLNKQDVTTNDLPEMQVIPVSWATTDQSGRAATSSSRFITVTFGISLCTDQMRTGDEAGIYPVLWHTLLALWNAVNRVPGAHEVRFLWPETGTFELAQRGGNSEEPAGGVRGWATIAQVRAMLVLNKEALGITG